MASKTNGLIQKIKPNATTYSIASTAYGVCETPANTDAKIVDMAGFTLLEGTTIHIKFTYNNTASSPTLNINNTGAKPIVQYGTTAVSTSSSTSGWYAGAVVSFTYDGTSWVRDQGFNTNSTYTITSVWCNTAAETAAKTFSNASYYTANDKSYFEITFRYTNTAQSALTLNGKELYINGMATSSSNYTLPAGKYLVYYENEIYYIRTDGKITGNITGDAATVNGLTVQTAVPANAVFTDTNKYHKSGSWNGLTYTADAVNEADELKFTIPDNYGDTKNPYGTKAKNLVLAGPSSGSNAAPSFRALVAADIPDLSKTYLPIQYTAPNFSSATITSGVYPVASITNPVTNANEFGGLIQFGSSTKAVNHYAAQLLISSASGAEKAVHAYIRRMTSKPGWSNSWSTLLDDKNTTAPSTVPSLSWGSESTVFTLNGTAVKIKAMAKPTYAFDDLTAHPITLDGYGITDANIASGTITLGSNTISPVTAITWDSNGKKLTRTINGEAADVVTAATLRTDLGLSNALHFIGVTSTTLTDGSTTSTLTAKSTGSLTKTSGFVDGDIVMDGDQLREYVWSGNAWRLLGITTSTAYSKTTSGNTFISSISQGTDGKVTADSRELDTSGNWNGTANKATNDSDGNPISSTYYKLDGSNTGTKLQISTQSYAYTNGIQFMNSTTKKGSIGTDNNGTIGIYGTKVALRPQLDASTKGVEVTTDAMYPIASMTLGTSSNKWSTVYATTFDGNATSATSSKVLSNQNGTYGTATTTSNRVTDTNIAHVNNGGVTHFKVGAATNGPAGGGNILHFYWDTSDAWNAQLHIPNNSANSMSWRASSAIGIWDSWRTLLDANNYTDYAVAKTAGVTAVTWDATNKKLTRTINGTDADVMTAAQMSTALGLGTIASKAATDYLPVKYSNLDYTSTTTTMGIYPINKQTHPVTGKTEYGGAIQFGGISTSNNYYAAQLLVSSENGGTYPVHAYIRRMTSTPGWSNWTALLDSNNYTDYTVTKTGTGASGSWGISITGSSASCTGNAATAAAIQTAGTTAQFYRGDNSWSNIIKQTANAALDITNLKIGTARKDLNFDIAKGSGTGINDGYAGGITWGTGDEAYAGIYYQASGSYGSRLIFGTTASYANGAYARMIIQNNGNVGIGTLSPDTLLTINGNAKATKFIGALEGNADTASKISAKLEATTKTYLLGTSTAITATAADVEVIGDTGVYLTTTAGQLNATTYLVNEKVRMEYNSTDQSLDFIFI